ncbi:MAG: PaaI family thioesterase [Treponema sp.]|nr:PaaI family thioesterase [Treponema sp.]
MTDLEKAKEFFNDDKFATQAAGIELVEVSDKYAKCYMKIQDKHLNAANMVMGGAIFTLADFAYAVASNFNQTPTVTRTSEITYLGQPRGDSLIAETKLIKDGRTTCTYEIIVKDEYNSMVALVISNGMKLNQQA